MARRFAALTVILLVGVIGTVAVTSWSGLPGGPGVAPRAAATPTATATAPPGTASASGPAATVPAVDPESGLPTIRRRDLPKAALVTLDLIAAGGPFPYSQDGSTYRNIERILPNRPGGYYREYTVETPGAADRGARRIVGGEAGELYWTADHYASFRRIVP
jgi:ribonuclease T1